MKYAILIRVQLFILKFQKKFVNTIGKCKYITIIMTEINTYNKLNKHKYEYKYIYINLQYIQLIFIFI